MRVFDYIQQKQICDARFPAGGTSILWAPEIVSCHISWRINLSSGFQTRSDTNQALRPQKMTRGLKFWIQEEEGLCCLCSENKGVD